MTQTPSSEHLLSRAWIEAKRGRRNRIPIDRPYAHMVEQELGPDGQVESVLTVFLSNRECPFRCLMCDLWQNTTTESTPAGTIPKQIAWAIRQHAKTTVIKLYNSGNFFDQRAIPQSDWPQIADLLQPYSRVIVECHPKLVTPRALEFRAAIPGTFEVAMGLETVDADNLARLNKGMTLEDFERALEFLHRSAIESRAFILIKTPFQSEPEAVRWSQASIDFALQRGVSCCSLLPTRTGNGAMDELQRRGDFSPPSLASVDAVFRYGLSRETGRVFLDPWSLERQFSCNLCRDAQIQRIELANQTQQLPAPLDCEKCLTTNE